MNKVYGQGESPYDNEVETVNCENCLGSGEVFVPSDEEGEDGFAEPCTCCGGTGQVSGKDMYEMEDDFFDNSADSLRDDDY